MKKAVVLLSGGLDSATALFWAKKKGYQTYGLLFDYGQKHSREIKSAVQLARQSRTPYQIIRFSLPWGGSALLEKNIAIPKRRNVKEMAQGVPVTYVPARNTIFLSFALSFADTLPAEAVVIGANAIDFSGYPDCRPSYMKAMQKVAMLGTKIGSEGKKIKILAPLTRMSKAQIIRLGLKLGVPYEFTWSCYEGGKKPCGECDSCILRKKGFQEIGVKDPLTK